MVRRRPALPLSVTSQVTSYLGARRRESWALKLHPKYTPCQKNLIFSPLLSCNLSDLIYVSHSWSWSTGHTRAGMAETLSRRNRPARPRMVRASRPGEARRETSCPTQRQRLGGNALQMPPLRQPFPHPQGRSSRLVTNNLKVTTTAPTGSPQQKKPAAEERRIRRLPPASQVN